MASIHSIRLFPVPFAKRSRRVQNELAFRD